MVSISTLFLGAVAALYVSSVGVPEKTDPEGNADPQTNPTPRGCELAQLSTTREFYRICWTTENETATPNRVFDVELVCDPDLEKTPSFRTVSQMMKEMTPEEKRRFWPVMQATFTTGFCGYADPGVQ
jgi:hypothetical protein